MSWLLVAVAALLTACGGGTGGAGNSSVYTGAFLDSAVQGLRYTTETQSGITNENGEFHYMDGESVTFYMGDIELGHGTAGSYMTPVDLVPGASNEMHPTVTNMTRLMQTLDEDGDPENGIYIPEEVMEMMQEMHINFEMDPGQFHNDDQVMMLMDSLDAMGGSYEDRSMVSVEDAQDHMGNTLMDIEEMMMGDDHMTGGGMM